MPPATHAPARPALTPEGLAAIDTAVERLVAEFKPEQVWLFGSYAWGDPMPAPTNRFKGLTMSNNWFVRPSQLNRTSR